MVAASWCQKGRQLVAVFIVGQLLPLIVLPLGIEYSVSIPSVGSSSAAGQSLSGLMIVGIIVVESLGILGYIKLKRRVSFSPLSILALIVIIIHIGVSIGIIVLGGRLYFWLTAGPYLLLLVFAVLVWLYLVAHLELEYRYRWWIVHNSLGFTLGVGAATVLGLSLPVVGAFGLLVALAVWDIIAVDYTNIMSGLMEATSNIFLPSYLILPTDTTVDYWALNAYIDGDHPSVPPSVTGIIGVGDIVFPAATVLAAVANGHLLLGAGVAIGVTAAIYLMTGYQHITNNRLLPAIPWVTGGALVGAIPALLTVLLR